MSLRPFAWDDLPTVVDIINRCDTVDGLERGTSEPELREWWTEPGIDPEANGFIATYESVGFRVREKTVTYRKTLRE